MPLIRNVKTNGRDNQNHSLQNTNIAIQTTRETKKYIQYSVVEELVDVIVF